MKRYLWIRLAVAAGLLCWLSTAGAEAPRRSGIAPVLSRLEVRVHPTFASSHAHRVVTVAPSKDVTGATDSAAIQAALTGAVKGTTVRLLAGDYYLGHALVAYGFVGTIRGAGMDRTTVHAVGTIRHFSAVEGDCSALGIGGTLEAEATPDNPWPMLWAFFGGNPTVADMTMTTDPGATAEFCIYGAGFSVIPAFVVITGSATGSTLSHLRLVGHAGSFYGYDIVQATYHEGILPGPDGYWVPLHGHHLVEGCDFEHVFAGTSVANTAADASLEFRNNVYGGDPDGLPLGEGLEVMSSAGRVTFEHNRASAAGETIIAIQGFSEASGTVRQTAPLYLTVAHNRIATTFYALDAMDLTDFQPAMFGTHALFARVIDNHFDLSGTDYGIIGNGLAHASLVDNSFAGKAALDGLDLGGPAPGSGYEMVFPLADYPTAGCRVVDNDLSRLTAGRYPVWLGPYSKGCLAVGHAAVHDDGAGNWVVATP